MSRVTLRTRAAWCHLFTGLYFKMYALILHSWQPHRSIKSSKSSSSPISDLRVITTTVTSANTLTKKKSALNQGLRHTD
jgi:hypothetical protein